jgi:hypothetical protein
VTAGVVTLGQVVELVAVLRVACTRCERVGQLRTNRLFVEHGDVAMPRLRELIAADCPRMQGGELRDPCGVHFPQLPELFG